MQGPAGWFAWLLLKRVQQYAVGQVHALLLLQAPLPLHRHHQPSIASLRPSPSQVLAGPRYQLAAEFALHLVQQCCVVEPVRC